MISQNHYKHMAQQGDVLVSFQKQVDQTQHMTSVNNLCCRLVISSIISEFLRR